MQKLSKTRFSQKTKPKRSRPTYTNCEMLKPSHNTVSYLRQLVGMVLLQGHQNLWKPCNLIGDTVFGIVNLFLPRDAMHPRY